MEIYYTKAPDGSTVVFFPHAKTDFSDGVYGQSGHDLSNAFANGVVAAGDLLEITTTYRPADEDGNGTKLTYLGPDHFAFGGMQGNHHFIPEKPYDGMPEGMIEGGITSWKKVGHTTAEEWNSMMREVFGDRVIKDQQA